jgi:hypothetical protein
MDGEQILPVQEHPDDFQVIATAVQVGQDGSTARLLIADRDLVIDKISIRHETSVGSATAQVRKINEGTAIGTGSGTTQVAPALALSAGHTTLKEFEIDEEENVLRKGQLLVILGAGGASSPLGTVTVRFRSRRT